MRRTFVAAVSAVVLATTGCSADDDAAGNTSALDDVVEPDEEGDATDVETALDEGLAAEDDVETEEADDAAEDALDDTADGGAAPGGVGSATVTVAGDTYELVVFQCVGPGEDPTGMFEFAGSAVSSEVPTELLAEALAADAPSEDTDDAEEVVLRNLEIVAELLDHGPTFGWQRWIGQGDLVALQLDGSTGWVIDVEDPDDATERFIDGDGRTYRGSAEVVRFPAGEYAQLTFEATCP